VESDGLFFRVVANAARPQPGYIPRGLPEAVAAPIEQAFRETFVPVWGRIPGWDKQCLLAYWRGEKPSILIADRYLPAHWRPCIQIVGSGLRTPFQCERGVSEMTFTVAVVQEQPERLRLLIAYLLAGALLFATDDHFRLIWDNVDGPLQIWKQDQGDDVTDEMCDRKYDELEADFHRAYDAALADTQRRWGFEKPLRIVWHGDEPEWGNS
jgi:hypothetical protein